MRRTIVVMAAGALALSGVALAAPAANAAKVLKPGPVTGLKVVASSSHDGTATFSWKAPAVIKGKTVKATSYAVACVDATTKTTKTSVVAVVTNSIATGTTCSVTAFAGKVAGSAVKSAAFSTYHQYGSSNIILSKTAVAFLGANVATTAPATTTANADGTVTLSFPVVTSADVADQTTVTNHAGSLSIGGVPVTNLQILPDPASTFDLPLMDLIGIAGGNSMPILQLSGITVNADNANEIDYTSARIYPDATVASTLAALLGVSTTTSNNYPLYGTLNPSKVAALGNPSGTTSLAADASAGDTSIVTARWVPSGSVVALDNAAGNVEYFTAGTVTENADGKTFTVPVASGELSRDHNAGAAISFTTDANPAAGQNYIFTKTVIPAGSLVTIGSGLGSESFVAGAEVNYGAVKVLAVSTVGGLRYDHSLTDALKFERIAHAGDTSIASTVNIPENSIVMINGSKAETFVAGATTNLGTNANGPWSTVVDGVDGLAKTHIGQVSITVIPQFDTPQPAVPAGPGGALIPIAGLPLGTGNTVFN